MKKPLRTNKLTLLLNDSEQLLLNRFCEKYRVENRSKLVREVLVKALLKQMDEDSPTLFD